MCLLPDMNAAIEKPHDTFRTICAGVKIKGEDKHGEVSDFRISSMPLRLESQT